MAALEIHRVSASEAAHHLLNRLAAASNDLVEYEEDVSDDAVYVAAGDLAEPAINLRKSSVNRLSSTRSVPVVDTPSLGSTPSATFESAEPALLTKSPSLKPVSPEEASSFEKFEMVASGTSGATTRSDKPGDTSRVRKYGRDVLTPSSPSPHAPLSSLSAADDAINVFSEVASLNSTLSAAAKMLKLSLDKAGTVQAEQAIFARRAAKQLLAVGLTHADGIDNPLNPRAARITLAAAAALGDDQVFDSSS